MKHLLVPYTFKLDDELELGGETSPKITVQVTKKFINQMIGPCVGKNIYVLKTNAEILSGEYSANFITYGNIYKTIRDIAIVSAYTYTGLWIEVPESMIDMIKEKDLKITFRWNCISDENGCHIDSISDVNLAYKPDEDSYLKSFLKPGCKYMLI